jgi:hypothetical protein
MNASVSGHGLILWRKKFWSDFNNILFASRTADAKSTKMALSFDILGATAGRSRHQKNPTPIWEEDPEEPGDYTVEIK